MHATANSQKIAKPASATNTCRPLTTLRKDRIMAAAILTQAFVQQALAYDPETGVFTWRASKRGSVKAGDSAGFTRSDGYIRIKVGQQAAWAHRLAWLYVYGVWPTHQIDHINGDPSDNRIANLRDVLPRINMQNERHGRRRKCGGSLIGAHWSKVWSRWKSSINSGGRAVHLGWFDTEQQAHEAYVTAKRRLHEGCTI